MAPSLHVLLSGPAQLCFGLLMDSAILSWNVRGLNNPARRRVVAGVVRDHHCKLVCLQETKLDSISNSIIAETLDPSFMDNFVFLPAVGTRGGILIAASSDHIKVTPQPLLQGTFSVSALITDLCCNSPWLLTGVYGPQSDEDKLNFLNEIRHIKALAPSEWVVLGDFNLISRASEKSNSNINLRMIRAFRAAIDDLHLKELPLIGRRFTWSNERLNSTLTKIDKVLFTEEWESRYPDFQLLPGSTDISDHCPLIMKKIQARHFSGFRFEAWWPNEDGFSEVVSQAWSKQLHTNDCIQKLHIKLTRTAKALKKWSKNLIKERRFCSAVASEVILQLDLAMENRSLTQQELDLRALLKGRLLALAAIQKIRWRQRSRLVWIRVGDANTKLFHLRANSRRRKNHIPVLQHGGHVASDHEDKAAVLKNHFISLLG